MSQEISRDALLIYLNNVRMLETMIAENQKMSKKLENKYADVITGDSRPDIPEPKEPHRPMEPIESMTLAFKPKFFNEMLMASTKIAIGWILLLPLGILGLFVFHDGFFHSMSILYFIVGIITLIISLVKGISAYREAMEAYETAQNNYGRELAEYEQEKEAYPRKQAEYMEARRKALNEFHEKATQKLQELRHLSHAAKNEANSLKADLQDAYNANIIPIQFRNIEGVYYLYDYLSTSNESLTSALMQANLEAIKQKLDNMIALQGAMIIQQAQANQAIFEQNQQILETAQSIENNTAVAAQYAKISAVNSAVSLRLQEQQLAYQKADFWLNL
ncbi:MAG: hypothetical protein IJ642_12725 [Oscillospiraceae bacterium]|nr:hypothetical protein [Oscillospiraceae bacterium]